MDENIDNLFQGILKIETIEECRNFFEDLCTISELQSMAQRFEVALMLDENEIYNEISAKTGASTATISRIASILKTSLFIVRKVPLPL